MVLLVTSGRRVLRSSKVFALCMVEYEFRFSKSVVEWFLNCLAINIKNTRVTP